MKAKLKIAVAGPYSASSQQARTANLDALNRAGAALLARGHIPVIGVNAALPVASLLPESEQYEAIMEISLALVALCDAVLVIGSSPGADRERDLVAASGRPVYFGIDSVPMNIDVNKRV